MADETLTSGEAYMFALLEEWKEIYILVKEFRVNFVSGRCDPSVVNLVIGATTNFYMLLSPKVHSHCGDSSWVETIKSFDYWRSWVQNPTYFQHRAAMNEIWNFSEMLGKVIEKLDVTYFPKARRDE